MFHVDSKVDSKRRDARLRNAAGARLGSTQHPAILRVQTEERKQEVTALCAENDWACEVTVDAEQPEDVGDLDILRNPIETVRVEQEPNRNDPCPCGSGKKYKHCHGRR